MRDSPRANPSAGWLASKLGVFRDLRQALGNVVDAQELSKTLGSYVNRVGYLRKSAKGRKRVDLTGAWVGAVSSAEARFARVRRDWVEGARRVRRYS
jgi:sRNA-binding protein